MTWQTSVSTCLLNKQIHWLKKLKEERKVDQKKSQRSVKSQGNLTSEPPCSHPHISPHSPPQAPSVIRGHRSPFPSAQPQPDLRVPIHSRLQIYLTPTGCSSQRILSQFEVLALKCFFAASGGSSPRSRGDWHEPQDTQEPGGSSLESNQPAGTGGRHAGDRRLPHNFRFRLRLGLTRSLVEGGRLLKGQCIC